MNEVIFVALYLAVSIFGLLGFIITPILSLWIGLRIAEACLGHVPLVGPHLAKPVHFLREKVEWLILWPFKKLWGLIGKGVKRTLEAAWRGFVIVMKRLGAAAWRGFVIVIRDIWSRIRGTP